MNCVECAEELTPGSRFCGACGTRQPVEEAPKAPEPTPACAACGAALPPGGRFCMACGAPAGAASAPHGPPPRPPAPPSAPASEDRGALLSAYRQGLAQGAQGAPEPTPEARAEYERIFAEHAEDGVIESDEAEDLLRHRRRLGIPEELHRTLMASVFDGVPLRLRFDVGRAHFVVGEMAQVTLEVQPAGGAAIRRFEVHYRTTVTDRRTESYRHGGRLTAQGTSFALSLEPPRVAGAHKLEGLLVATELGGRVFRGRFDLPPLKFDPAAAANGPQQVSISVDASKAAAGQVNVGSAFAGPARTTGGVQVSLGDWLSIQVHPVSADDAAEWLSPPVAPPASPVAPSARVRGTALRCRGIYLNLFRAAERPRELWWLRDDEVSFGRFHDPATNADLELVLEPRSVAANEAHNAYLSRRHLALRRTDRGAVLVGLSAGQRPCTLQGRPLAGGASSEPLMDARVEVVPGLALEVTCWRNAHGAVEGVHAARKGNVEHRAYVIAGRGLGVWEGRPGFVGLLGGDGAPAPVAIVWHEGAPALRNVSAAELRCDKQRVPVGESRYLAPGQMWTLGALTLEVTDEVLREKS